MTSFHPDSSLAQLVLAGFAKLNGSGTLEATPAGCGGGERTSCASGPTAVDSYSSQNGIRKNVSLERYAFTPPSYALTGDPLRELKLALQSPGNPGSELIAKFYFWGGSKPVTPEGLLVDYAMCSRFVETAQTVLDQFSVGQMSHWATDLCHTIPIALNEKKRDINLSLGIREPYSSLELRVPRGLLEHHKPSLAVLLYEARSVFETLRTASSS